MSCKAMREQQEIEKEVEEVIEKVPEAPPKQEILEKIDQEAHRMIELQKLLDRKPNLKYKEMAPLLKEAAKRVLGPIKKKAEQFAGHSLFAKPTNQSSEK